MKRGSLTACVAASALVLLGVLALARGGAQAQQADTTPPVFVSATTDGTSIVITFSEDIFVSPLLSYVQEFSGEPMSLFLKAVFTVTIDGHDVTLAENNFISGRELALHLAYYPGGDDTVTVSHDNIFVTNAPGLLIDAAGNALASFTSQTVQNAPPGDSNIAPGPTLDPLNVTITEGGTGTYTVALPSQPSGPVTVTLLPYPVVRVRPAVLTFTVDNWDEPQVITLTAADDNDSIDAWAAVLHQVEGVSNVNWTFVRIVVEDQDTPLEVTGNLSTAFAENGTGPVTTYAVTGGGSIRWSLLGDDKDLFSISSSGVLSFRSPPDYEVPSAQDDDNVYRVFVHAASRSSTGFLPVAVAVTNIAEPPKYASASTTREVPENSGAGVDVGAPVQASDDAGDTLTYTLEGTDAASFAIDSATGQIQTTSGVTYDHEAKSSYTVTVTATDGNTPPQSATSSVRITVANLNDAPAFPATETGLRTVDENVPAGTAIGAAVVATDQDRDTLRYTLTGSDAGRFVIDQGTGQIRAKPGVTYDFEDQEDYAVTVDVSDGEDIDGEDETVPVVDASQDVIVTLRDVNEKPVVTGPVSATYDENDTRSVAIYSAVDKDAGDTVTWSSVGRDSTLFAIDGGVLTFRDPPDYEARTPSVYRVTVRAQDSGRLSDSRNLTVTVLNRNEAPVLTGESTAQYPEHGTGAIQTYRATDPEMSPILWSLDDPTIFTIEGGVLAFRTPPDYEDQPTHTVTVQASDGVERASRTVTVNIGNLDERGALKLSSAQPLTGTAFTATLTDPDRGMSGQSWTWERSPNRSNWTEIGSVAVETHTPGDDDLNQYLRVTVEYTDDHGPGKSLTAVSERKVLTPRPGNQAPVFEGTPFTRAVPENSTAPKLVGAPVQARDPDAGDVLGYSLLGGNASLFTIDSGTGQIRVADGTILNHEDRPSLQVTVEAADPYGEYVSTAVTIDVTDVNEAPVAMDDPNPSTFEDTPVTIGVLQNAADPDPNDSLAVFLHRMPRNGEAVVETNGDITYTPNSNFAGSDNFVYRISDGRLTDTATVIVAVTPVNDAPSFPAPSLARGVRSSAVAGTNVGSPVTATDVDGNPLEYTLSGAGPFTIDQFSGQITVTGPLTLGEHTVAVATTDGKGGTDEVDVVITVSLLGPSPAAPVGGGGAGGGGGGGGPTPSEVDFEWTVRHDIDELAGGHDTPSGLWSDGATLWLAENGAGADDAIYAYDLSTGERVEEREFELDEANRAPRGAWSDRTVIWISDSGQEKLFAHDLTSGGRLPARDIALAERNRDARGIWSDGETMWVLDGGKNSLFAYALASGELLAEYELASANGDPHGIWSDGTTIWVSDHGAKRLFAYRLPAPEGPAAEDAEPQDLERVSDEEFPSTVLSRASNNSPRGIWSDGDVMYVADESDDRIYSYNVPDAIDARLASLTLSGIDYGEFDPGSTEYEGSVAEGVTETTAEAEAMQRRTAVVIDPPDADGEAEGHQIALQDLAEITVTVTSADGSRKKTYRVRLGETEQESVPEPWPHCLRGDVAIGFSLVVFEGGSVEELEACAQNRSVTALYALEGGAYVSYILGAPAFVNERFGELYAGGAPALTPLTVKSEGPPSADPAQSEGPATSWTNCLRGTVVTAFSLVIFEGGDTGELESCARSHNITAVYTLDDGDFVSLVLGAPDFVNRAFFELYEGGLPPVTPLLARSDGPPAPGAGR